MKMTIVSMIVALFGFSAMAHEDGSAVAPAGTPPAADHGHAHGDGAKMEKKAKKAKKDKKAAKEEVKKEEAPAPAH